MTQASDPEYNRIAITVQLLLHGGETYHNVFDMGTTR